MDLTRRQREFVHDAAHELLNPLTICRGHLELLGNDPAESRRTIALVLDELDRMGRIIEDLQLLAEVGEPDSLEPDLIDLELFTHELVAAASALSSREWTIDHTAAGTLNGDAQRLTEAVTRLVLNAARHTPADGIVALGTSLHEEMARLWVRDTGPGISVADQRHIFDRFARGTDTPVAHRGSGLGLTAVKAIAEAHGGQVEVESQLGEGSTFTIVIPAGS